MNERKEFITVWVRDPRVQKEDSWQSFVDYEICVHTNSMCFTKKTSCVRRRYKEFAWLRQRLQDNAVLMVQNTVLRVTHNIRHEAHVRYRQNTSHRKSPESMNVAAVCSRIQYGLSPSERTLGSTLDTVTRHTSTMVEPHRLPPGSLPEIPPKIPFFSGSNSQLVEQRRQGLQEFLEKCVQLSFSVINSQSVTEQHPPFGQ
ncbi:sorting nexin-10B isoform X2 [Hypanus sabinus]|uniref:sorting nexin-10B isoform X2 n=1 Tax=Hypanus sabinus TaxID=79690 RepID=UPI0028C4E881|nr:sorting nexin-10B isoform X2 [Hypanus sabinus]